MSQFTPRPASDDLYLTKGEAAKLLGYSERTIDRWMRAGWLRYYRLPNGQVRFKRSEVLEAFDRQCEEGKNPKMPDLG